MTYHAEVVPLDDYVKGVLPNEWFRYWEQEALRAGAIAVKNYGVSIYNSQGFVWDCTWNQVYDPADRTPETDKAVEDTWDLWLVDSDYQLVRTYFNSDKWGCATQGENCLSQLESQRLARQGYLLRFIILTNYEGTLISLYNE